MTVSIKQHLDEIRAGKVGAEKDAQGGEKRASLRRMKRGYSVNWQAAFHIFDFHGTEHR